MVEGQIRVLVATTVASTVRSFLLDMLSDLERRGCLVTVATNTDDSVIANELRQKHGLSLAHVPWSRSPSDVSNVRAAARMRTLLQDSDVVEVHTPIAAAITRIAARTVPVSRRPTVFYFAHGFHFQSLEPQGSQRIWYLIERLLARSTDKIFVINKADKRLARKALRYDASQVLPIDGVGLDLSHYTPDSGQVEERTLAVVGALDPGKRPLEALEAIASVDPPCHVIFAGAGPLEAEVRDRAAALGVSIEMPGRVEDIRGVLCRAKALVFLSEREGLPRSVMEAVAMGLPVVAHNIRGVSDILDGQEWWFMPRSRAPEDVAEQIELAIGASTTFDTAMMRQSLQRFDSDEIARVHSAALLTG